MTYKSLKRLFKKPKKRIIKLSSREPEREEPVEETGPEGRKESNEFLFSDEQDSEQNERASDDSFDDKIYKKLMEKDNHVGAGTSLPSRKTLPNIPISHSASQDPNPPLDLNNNSSGVYSTLGRPEMILSGPSNDPQRTVPLIKMKSYQEIESEMKRRDSNLSLNEKIALRMMAKSSLLYEEPSEMIPEGSSAIIYHSNESSTSDAADVDSEMEAFIKPIETILVKGHGKFNISSPQDTLSSTRDELSDMIKEVDSFISGFSTKNNENVPNQGNFKSGNWAAKHPSAEQYSQVHERSRLQQRLKEKVIARNLTSSRESSPKKSSKEANLDVDVSGLINVCESKSASPISPSPKHDIQMKPIQSIQLPSPSSVPVEEEKDDPVQTLFIFISQLDTSNVDPSILDYLVKAVGAFARERGSNRSEAACQTNFEGNVCDLGVQCILDEGNILNVNNQECQYDHDMLSKVDFYCQTGHGFWQLQDVDVQTDHVTISDKVSVEYSNGKHQSKPSIHESSEEDDSKRISSESKDEQKLAVRGKRKGMIFFKPDDSQVPLQLDLDQHYMLMKSETQEKSEEKVKNGKLMNKPSISLMKEFGAKFKLKSSKSFMKVKVPFSTSPVRNSEDGSAKSSGLEGAEETSVMGTARSAETPSIILMELDSSRNEIESGSVEETQENIVAKEYQIDIDKEDNGTIVDVSLEDVSKKSSALVKEIEPTKTMQEKGEMKTSFSTLTRIFSKK